MFQFAVRSCSTDAARWRSVMSVTNANARIPPGVAT
jgi:hypothetical protein